MRQSHTGLTPVWLLLMILTLLSALIAEKVDPTALIVAIVCFTVAVKGGLVIEWLMGLRAITGSVRWLMLSYFLLLPPAIALSVIFPEVLKRFTSL